MMMSEVKTIRILYMEDDAGLARLLQKRLQKKSYVVDIACDGKEGLAALDGGEHDILLVDYDMPVCGGLDVIRTLKSQDMLPPTIMVTGKGNEEVAVEAIKLGAADYIVKDVELGYLELLPVVIENVLRKEQLIREKREMLETIKESEDRYMQLVKLSPDGISIHVGGKFIFMNPSGARLLGAKEPEELLGKSLLDFIHRDYRQMVLIRLKQLEKEANAMPWTEQRLVRLDGIDVEVELAGVPFRYKGEIAEQIIFRDITERKVAAQRLEYLALYDSLTGLHNRVSFLDHLGQLLAQAKRYNHMLGLLYMDLDRFKAVNDKLGHNIGDLLLTEAADRLKECLRSSDLPARIGGDEFIAILTNISNIQDVATIAQRIIASFVKPYSLDGHKCSIGVSIGVSLYPSDGNDMGTLIKNADFAMYNAKKAGGGSFQFFSPDQNP